ncbi:MAG: purine-nucleoside phosphorylase [Bacteroidetes bacterium]|nr:purine-nucleoside phosphorylase [Bacteroidota bacterium]
MIKKINETVNYLKSQGIEKPEIGIVLGTGLGDLINHIEIIKTIAYSSIPNFPVTTVGFHQGKLIYGTIADKTILVMQGRFHYYEGYSFQEITFPIRVMKLLGINYLLLSNAAGGINLDFKKGDLIAIDDHINLLPGNPLMGKNLDDLGDRFPDMSAPYSYMMCDLFQQACQYFGVPFKKGVYVAVSGPQLETRAEYTFLKIIGADMVGMSTVPEVIVSSHMKLPCFAVSVITDECDPKNLKPVNISEIIEVAGKSDKLLTKIFCEMIEKLDVS